MNVSKNSIKYMERALCAYPVALSEYLNRRIEELFCVDCDSYSINSAVKNMEDVNYFSNRNHGDVLNMQHLMDCGMHEHVEHKGLRKVEYISVAFTYAYSVVCRFSQEFPQYILVAVIKAQLVTQPAPLPIKMTKPMTRVSFYMYNPSSDLECLDTYKNRPQHSEKVMLWTFSTFDIPFIEWMMGNIQYMKNDKANSKFKERACKSRVSDLAVQK